MERLLTKEDLADRLQVSLRTVDMWIAEKVLPVVKPTKKLVRFRPADVELFIEERRELD